MKQLQHMKCLTYIICRSFKPATSLDDKIKLLQVMFESVEEMLTSPDYDKDLQSDLTAACPNYMTVFLTAKRDLLTKDFGIVVTGQSITCL